MVSEYSLPDEIVLDSHNYCVEVIRRSSLLEPTGDTYSYLVSICCFGLGDQDLSITPTSFLVSIISYIQSVSELPHCVERVNPHQLYLHINTTDSEFIQKLRSYIYLFDVRRDEVVNDYPL